MDQATLQRYLDALPPDTPQPVQTDAWGRAGRNLANLPGNILEGLTNTVTGLMDPVGAQQGPHVNIPDFFPTERPPASFGESAADVVLGKQGLVDTLGQSLAETAAAGGVGKLMGMSEGPALESLKWGAGFAGPETQRPDATGTDVAVAGGLGAMSGPLMLLKRKQRILPTAVMALLHGGYEQYQHGDPMMSGIAGAVDFAGTMLPGVHVPETNFNSPIQFGLADDPKLSWDSPQNIEQHTMYKQELARMQSEQAAAAADRAAYEQGGRGSLKEGVKLINPEGTPDYWGTTADLQQSFADSMTSDRTTAAGIADRRAAFAPDELGNRKIATLQNEGELVNPPQILTGIETNPSSLVSVESFGGARSPDQVAAMHFASEGPLGLDNPQSTAQAAKYRDQLLQLDTPEPPIQPKSSFATLQTPDRVKKPYIRKSKTEVTPTAPEPVVTEPAPVVPETAVQPSALQPTAEQIAYHVQRLTERTRQGNFSAKMSEGELRGMMSELDNDIANTLDPEAQTDFRATRAAVEQLLHGSSAPEPAVRPEPIAPLASAGGPEPFKVQQRVKIGKAGKEQHGTYEGMTDSGQAKVRFDGDTEATSINPKKLKASDVQGEVPEIATLQKLKSKGLTDDDTDFLGKWLTDQGLKDLETGGLDEVPDEIKGQAFESRAGVGVGPKPRETFATHPSGLPKAAVKAVDQIVDSVKATVSRHLKIKFATNFKDAATLAHSLPGGEIEINTDKLIEGLDSWHKMSNLERAQVLANTARVVSHEVGHTVLSLMAAKEPQVFRALLDEFHALGYQGRRAILEDFHSSIGLKDPLTTAYAAGAESEMSAAYNWHPENTKALEYSGLHEFFAEMSAAHIFGKLKEEMLPPEMRSLWQRFKDLMRSVVERLFKDGPEGDSIDEHLAYKNFHSILSDLHDRFSSLSEAQYREASQGSTEQNIRIHKALKRVDSQIKLRQAVEDFETQSERIVQEDRASAQASASQESIRENKPKWNGDTGRYEWEDGTAAFQSRSGIATLQNQPASGMSSAIVGNRAFIEAQMLRHLGYGIGGMVAGGILAPKLTNGQLTVAEGVFMGGVLGFAGPVVLRRLFATMPKQGAITFQHLSTKEAFKKLFTSAGRMQLGGDAATGQGSAPAMFVRFLEKNLNLHLPQQIYNAVIESEGPASYAVQIAHDAFSKSRTFETNGVIDRAVTDYLTGKSNVATLRAVLGNNADAQHFANFIVTGRESIGLLQEMFQSGLPDGAFKRQIIASLQKGDYLTRQYRIFHDVDYHPTQSQIEAVALSLTHAHPEYNLATSRILVEDYLHQIIAERGMYSGGKGDIGQKLDAAIFQKRNDTLGAAFRDALGEYKDPKEKIMGTIRHLYTNAMSSKFYDHVSSMTDSDGLKLSYTREEHTATAQAVEAKLRRPPAGITAQEIATLQKQKQLLQYFVPLDGSVRYGKLKNKLVNRFVRDQLASFDSPWGIMDGSIMRSLSSFHNWVKVGRTALNPITTVRNFVGAPILMGLARANPFHIKGTLAAMKDFSTGMGREMLEHGIIGVDQVRGEFFRSSSQILMGDYDHRGLEGIFKTGMNKVLEFYRMPDVLVRGATYLTAKERFAKDFSLPQSDRRVIDAARDWTNRYTINYANVAPLVKTARQLPFTNLFISFTSEITRIAKNLVEDVFTHPNAGQRVFAAGAIGGLSAIPFLMEKASINNLSPKDKEEWEKSQAQMPDYSRNRFRIVLGKDGKKFRYLDITPLLQIDQLLQMMRSAGQRDWKAMLATNPVLSWENTPILNIASEQISGLDNRTQRPLDTYTKRMQEVAKEIVPPIAPGGYEWQRATEAFSPTQSGELGQTNLRTGRRTTPSELVTNYLTGMRLSTIDTSMVHRSVVSEAKRQIANEASYLRDITNTDLPKPVQQKAIDRYVKSVSEILSDMHNKLEGRIP